MRKLGIICIDDEAIVLESLKEQLKRNLSTEPTCVIEVADTGEEALDIIEELKIDNIDVALIISDQIMPGMSGDELLARIHDRHPNILKILLTGEASTEAVGNAVNQANLYRYITKPWDELDLTLTVTEALRRYQQETQLAEQNKTLREVNRALADLNATLEEKVEERTLALQQANAQLKEAKTVAEVASQAKSAFLASMSHELRTPLNAILGFSQILSRDRSLKTDQQEQLTIINRSGEHLLNLINDVLEMSKIEAGKMTLNLDRVNLHNLLEDLCAMLGLKADAKGLQLLLDQAPDLPTHVEADSSKLRQVLINLLGNAVKFTETGTVKLKAKSRLIPHGDTANTASSPMQIVTFAVEDTGPGIASDELTQVFEAFTQTATGRYAQTGTGLGLAISSQLVQLMGGKLQVNSQVGVGSRFWFEIPLSVVSLGGIPQKSKWVLSLAPNQPSYRVLVADDVAELRLLLKHMLSEVGFEVQEAGEGATAIALWQTWHPHLILMDWQMPTMDGETATRQIRRAAGGSDPKIIAVSAGAFDESRQALKAAGCDDVILKPFTETTLFETIARHLPVQYQYAEQPDSLTAPQTAAKTPSKAISPEVLLNTLQTVMSSVWLADFYQAVSILDAEDGITLINQIPEEHSEIRQTLTNHINNFRFDILIDLLKAACS
ncbi:MAG: response regulator [Cyanobacteria bacterium J06639_14]